MKADFSIETDNYEVIFLTHLDDMNFRRASLS